MLNQQGRPDCLNQQQYAYTFEDKAGRQGIHILNEPVESMIRKVLRMYGVNEECTRQTKRARKIIIETLEYNFSVVIYDNYCQNMTDAFLQILKYIKVLDFTNYTVSIRPVGNSYHMLSFPYLMQKKLINFIQPIESIKLPALIKLNLSGVQMSNSENIAFLDCPNLAEMELHIKTLRDLKSFGKTKFQNLQRVVLLISDQINLKSISKAHLKKEIKYFSILAVYDEEQYQENHQYIQISSFAKSQFKKANKLTFNKSSNEISSRVKKFLKQFKSLNIEFIDEDSQQFSYVSEGQQNESSQLSQSSSSEQDRRGLGRKI